MEIAIIGAGIGGLTMGVVLKKQNIPFKIYESASEIKAVGAGIILVINAMQVYEKLGLHKKIENQGHIIHEMNIVNPNFEMLSEGDIRPFEQQFGLSNIAIHRSDLHAILAEEVGFENIELGKKLNQICKIPTGYSLKFEDGAEAESAYVIGADGIHSTVRHFLFQKSELRNAKQYCWRGVTDFQTLEKSNHKLTESWAKGKRFGFTQISENKVYWYFLISQNLGNPASNPLDFVGDFHPLAREIMVSTPKENIHFAPIFDLKPIKIWSFKDVCLLGDAAHATTPNLGQGACQAIEDAYVLGKLLETHSVEKSFEKYPEIRKKKVEMIVETSWRIGKISQWQNPLAISFRNFMMKILPKNSTQKQFAKIFLLDI